MIISPWEGDLYSPNWRVKALESPVGEEERESQNETPFEYSEFWALRVFWALRMPILIPYFHGTAILNSAQCPYVQRPFD